MHSARSRFAIRVAPGRVVAAVRQMSSPAISSNLGKTLPRRVPRRSFRYEDAIPKDGERLPKNCFFSRRQAWVGCEARQQESGNKFVTINQESTQI